MMDKLPPLGRRIEDVLFPTFGAYEELLKAKADEIRSTRHETHAFGFEARHKLDVYYPTRASSSAPSGAKPVPVLAFFYGGGFVGGDRVNEAYADGLVFGNLGHYFASRFGFTVVVADYRLMAHGARYPSGGEDVGLAVEWIATTLARRDDAYASIDLFLMGNSAGGIHVSTYLLDPTFAAARDTILAGERREGKGKGTLLRGVLLLGVPLHWGAEDNETLRAYFGEGKLYANSPMGLLEAAKKDGSNGPFDLPGVKLAVVVSELDPEFIFDTADEFKRAWPGPDVEVRVLKGHNHISPQLGLGTGIEREEAWGVQAAEFFQSCASK